MNYPIIPDFKFDLNQEFEVNKIPAEPYVLGDEQNVFVPNHAPFFIDSLVLRDDKGQKLTKGTDYRIFRMMGHLSSLCATGVACLIEILNPNLKTIVSEYHSVGHSSLFDRSLIELINNAANDQRLIKWPNIHDKPVVFRPKFHTHSMPYDSVMWQDMITMITEWTDSLTTTNDDFGAIALKTQTDLVRRYIDRSSDYINFLLARHVGDYNEHNLTKAQIGKDKVENIPTASKSDAVKGIRNHRITPAALEEIIKRYGFSDSAFLKANVLPISFYGNTSFIPPAIGGSFEGLGSRNEAAAMCMESDGTISYLSNHFDGRVDGLYFSIVNGYPNNISMSYQSFRYDHPVLTNAGIVPNVVCQGGGDEVLLVGDSVRKRWFVALTNGTLNPSFHTMVELDMTNFQNNALSAQTTSVHLMGNFVVIIQAFASPGNEIGYDSRRFLRIPIQQIKTSSYVTPSRMNLSFTNWDGRVFTGATDFLWTEAVKDVNGNFTRYMYKYNRPLNAYNTGNGLYRTQGNLSCPIPNKPGWFLVKMRAHSYVPYYLPDGVTTTAYSSSPELLYEFNPGTGVMNILDQKSMLTINLDNGVDPTVQVQNYYGAPHHVTVQSFDSNCVTVLNDGNWLVSTTSEVYRTPHQIALLVSGAKTKYDAMSKKFTTLNYPLMQLVASPVESITSPIKNSIYPGSVTYDPEGEFFISVGQKTSDRRKIFLRKVSGEYAVRDGFENINYASVYSRPLSNNVFETNLISEQPRAGITGDAAFLSAAGMTNLGETSFMMGFAGKHFVNPATGWGENTPKDRSVRIARTVNRTIDANGVYNYTPTGFITYPVAIINQLINTIVPVANRNSPDFSITVLDTKFWNNAKVTSRPVVIMIHYVDLATTMRRCAIATLNTTYNTSNAADYIVTAASVISSRVNDVMSQQSNVTPTSWPVDVNLRSQASNAAELYYSGTTIEIIINTAYTTQHLGNAGNHGAAITINQAGHAILSGGGYNQTWEGGAQLSLIPKVGSGSKLAPSASGATAELIGVGSTVYGRISCYPDPAWSLFFQSDIDPVFNGKSYHMLAGVVDLRSIKADPSNTTFYIYLRLVSGEPQYIITEVKTFDTTYNMWIGTVVTNASQILSISRSNVLLLNGARISETKRGGAIPASNGLITEQGQFPWLRNSEIISG